MAIDLNMHFILSADITNDLNVELSRVVCELESALERKPLPLEANNEVFTETVTPNRTAVNEKTMQVTTELCPVTGLII